MIRFLSADEVDTFRTIRLEALKQEPAAFASTYADWAALSHEEWQGRLQRCSVIAAFDGDMPVGMMGLLPVEADLELIMVYLRASHRGQGLAEGMLDKLNELAWSQGAQRLVLRAHSGNKAALRFYEKAGFRFLPAQHCDGCDIRMERPHSALDNRG